MKVLLFSLALLSTQAFAASANGTSKVYDMMNDVKMITISGNSAKLLYDSLNVRQDNFPGEADQKVGKNVTCNKIFQRSGKSTYTCEISVDKKGKVGNGAAG